MKIYLLKKYRVVSVDLKYSSKMPISIMEMSKIWIPQFSTFLKNIFLCFIYACWVDGKGVGVWVGNNPHSQQNI